MSSDLKVINWTSKDVHVTLNVGSAHRLNAPSRDSSCYVPTVRSWPRDTTSQRKRGDRWGSVNDLTVDVWWGGESHWYDLADPRGAAMDLELLLWVFPDYLVFSQAGRQLGDVVPPDKRVASTGGSLDAKACSFFLNGTGEDIEIGLNSGKRRALDGSLSHFPSCGSTRYDFEPSPGKDVLGMGDNTLEVVANGRTTYWNVRLEDPVRIAEDVQVVIFENRLMPRNVDTTEGFEINLLLLLCEHDQKGALYASSGNNPAFEGAALLYYYLFLEEGGGEPPEALSVALSWKLDGTYVFVDDEVAALDLLRELTTLEKGVSDFPIFAWRHGADDYEVINASYRRVIRGGRFHIGNWRVDFQGTDLDMDPAMQGVRFTNSPFGFSVNRLRPEGGVVAIGSRSNEALMPLSGMNCGTLSFSWKWNQYELGRDFGGDLRIFCERSAGGEITESLTTVHYPLFRPAAIPRAEPENDLHFEVHLQPLARLDDRKTRLALDLRKPIPLVSRFFSSVTNASVDLEPVAPVSGGLAPGFGFAKDPGWSGRYLCPVGEYEVHALGDAGGSARVQVRGGTAATEYLLLKPGDRLSFRGGQPAFAAGYDPADGGRNCLDPTFTTSWARIVPAPRSEPEKESVGTSYCAQAPSSTFFGAGLDFAESRYDFPVAVGASLARFLGSQSETLFPTLPYRGVYYENDDDRIKNPNPELTAQELEAIERQIVSPERRSALERLFDWCHGPVFFDTSTNLALAGGFARTPLGLLAGLNPVAGGTPPAGTIQRIILAVSPQNPDQFLQLSPGADGVVNPIFANTVLDDNLFLVATDESALAPLDNLTQLGDFTYEVNLGNDPETEAIAVFKFRRGVSARDLINETDAWTPLLGGATAVQVQERLKQSLDQADGGGDLFADFRRKIDDPDWNGLLIFNCPLKYDALPLDIKILLGGIDGQLLAHHFGVTMNRVEEQNGSVEHSSLFSVINYDEDFREPPQFPDFQVLVFNVRFANSKLAVFDSRIAFSIKQLFESDVTLKVGPDPNKQTGTIEIDGVYTLFEDGTGSLVFSTEHARSYVYDTTSFFTPLTAQSVTEATLVPISEDPGSGDCVTIAKSAFRLSGLLAFRDDIGGDLFSYGKVESDLPTEGLAVAGYAFPMDTCIEAENTAELMQPIAISLDDLKVDQVLSKARAESLEQNFPSLIQSLENTPDGLRPVDVGEWQVKVEGSSFTGAPVFSLNFDVPLGTLGALLALKTDLTAQLFVGWNPAEENDSENRIGVMLRLPAEVSGPGGFSFQGVIKSGFDYVQLNRFSGPNIYCLLFVHYQAYFLSLFFNYSRGPKDLGLFGGPRNPGGNNSMFFVGKSADDEWEGPTLSAVLDGFPDVFLGRAFEIETDPTDPNVIDEIYQELSLMSDKTVEQFANLIFANSWLYNSDAGIAFTTKFTYKSLTLTAVFHDCTVYGVQIKIKGEKKDPEEPEDPPPPPPDDPEDPPLPPPSGSDLAGEIAGALVPSETAAFAVMKEENSNGLLAKFKDFTFTIIYRKVSDEVGVYSGDIYLDVGQIQLGVAQLSLPNFSIAIWTNGDWRFAIGWPFNGDSAQPFTVQFLAGGVPVIVKAGFYLGKLSSAAAPEQFGDQFHLIWTFGMGVGGGVGKEFKEGPLKAGASLILSLTVEGFLASCDGTLTDEGVDYYWWGISLSLTGNLFGEVDFKLIVVDVSLTLGITTAFATETLHKSPLVLTAEVKVKASVKIVFVKISFSFETTLDIFSTTFGSGDVVAKLDAPSPTAIPYRCGMPAETLQRLKAASSTAPGFRAPGPAFVRAAADPVPITIGYVMQPTSISTDGVNWAPQGVATLQMMTGDAASPFGLLATGLAEWLVDQYGGNGNFHEQLAATRFRLDQGDFNRDYEEALSSLFRFEVGPTEFAAETEVVTLAMPPSLAVQYPPEEPVVIALEDAPRESFGARPLPANYLERVAAYFAGTEMPALRGSDGPSAAEEVFEGYFVGLAQQLVQLLIDTGAPDLETALAEIDLGDLGGYVSRFLNGGVRLPVDDRLEALYLLTGQQFALQKQGGDFVLDSRLVSSGTTPAWITVAEPTESSLEPSMVHTARPSIPPWQLEQLSELTGRPLIFPMNNSVNWIDAAGKELVITTLPDALLQPIRELGGDTNNLFLVQKLMGGESDEDQQVDLAGPGIPWIASAALALPVQLAAIPDPSGAPGEILPSVFSLLGTDEANRALLQKLLADREASIQSVELLVSVSRGNYTSSETPKVLVRTDLSTDSSAPGVVALRSVEDAAAGGDTFCSNYAKPGEGGEQLKRFLRLVWEVSIVHSSGFYLEVEKLIPEMFDDGPADLLLLVRFGTPGSTLDATAYQNALVGEAPDAGKALFSTLANDRQGTPIKGYTAAYPGGDVGWSITWEGAPDEADAASPGFLQELYQTVSFRAVSVNGREVDTPWSHPVTAQDVSPKGASSVTWNYQRAFETAPLIPADNRYAAIGDTITVQISFEDVFGNTLPESLLPTIDLTVAYNDDILGCGDWAGAQANYQVVDSDGVRLELLLSFDESVVQDTDGNVDQEQVEVTTALYERLLDQLEDPNLSAGIGTGGILAADLLDTLVGGASLVSGLQGFVRRLLEWLHAGGTGDPPSPVALAMALDKTYPTRWSGDLRELRVSLELMRTNVPEGIATLAPQVRQVISPIQPVEDTGAAEDPSGLTTFANHFETAYFPYDGDKGVVKVATGLNSDVTSQNFGRRGIWLQRWSGGGEGTDVKILNDSENPPVFYAPPPLSTQLITREVQGVRVYETPTVFTEIDRVFAATDMDLLAADFLAAVETIFRPVMAPAVADHSTSSVELYDPFVTNKESLAGSISNKVEYVYDEARGTGDPPSAKETWRQALLRTLENDYGFSTLTQLEALVRLKGQIEPGGDPNNPPLVFGAVQVPGEPKMDDLPYSLTPTTLPLVDGTNWLNFLVSAQDPTAQRAFNLDLNYEVTQIEHLRDGASEACGYTPSSWITFVLQQNPQPLPQGQDNTLTQPIGDTRIPIPLRSYPPLPKILATSAAQNESITTIAEALTWTFNVSVERSRADQDSLNLFLTFNQPQPAAVPPPEARLLASGRPEPSDLFEALARFAAEYPQLKPFVDDLPEDGPDSVVAVQEFSDLIGGAALKWPEWKPPTPGPSTPDTDSDVWSFRIENIEGQDKLQVTRSGDSAPFPEIVGYQKDSETGHTAVYEPDDGSLGLLEMSWPDLYVLDYQNVLPSAYTERNRNLAPENQETNPAFIYRTETVAWPTPIVPLVNVGELIRLDSESSLESSVEAMLKQLATPPPGSTTNGSGSDLMLETSIDYRYQIMVNPNIGSRSFSLLPVFLLDKKLKPGGEAAAANEIACQLMKWRDNTGADAPQSSLRFLLTLFATTIVTSEDRLPLVQFLGLVIEVPHNPGWWTVAGCDS